MESGVVHESIVQYIRLHYSMRRCIGWDENCKRQITINGWQSGASEWKPAEAVGRRYHSGAGKTEWLYPRIFYGNGGYRYLSWLMSSAAELDLGLHENIQLLLPWNAPTMCRTN